MSEEHPWNNLNFVKFRIVVVVVVNVKLRIIVVVVVNVKLRIIID